MFRYLLSITILVCILNTVWCINDSSPVELKIYELFKEEPELKEEAKVNVTVFFSYKCPYSRAFIREELVPAFRAIGRIFEPKLVPFTTPKIINQSHRTAKSVHSNEMKIACIMTLGRSMEDIMDTFECAMAENGLIVEECVEENMKYVEDHQFLQCARSRISFEIIKANTLLAEKKEINFVPWIEINGEHWEGDDFRVAICDEYTGEKPDECF